MEYNYSFMQSDDEVDRLLQLIEISQLNMKHIEKLQQSTEHDLVDIRDKLEQCFTLQAAIQKKYKEMKFSLRTKRTSGESYEKSAEPITFRAVYNAPPKAIAAIKPWYDLTYISMTKKLKTNRVILSKLGIEGSIGEYQLHRFILTSSNLFMRKSKI